jgi:hypothetical protein
MTATGSLFIIERGFFRFLALKSADRRISFGRERITSGHNGSWLISAFNGVDTSGFVLAEGNGGLTREPAEFEEGDFGLRLKVDGLLGLGADFPESEVDTIFCIVSRASASVTPASTAFFTQASWPCFVVSF